MCKTVTIIQARMGSSRLPGKVLRPLGGMPALHWVVSRVVQSMWHGSVVVATSDSIVDEPVVEWCKVSGVCCFRGSESDVLDRFYQCSIAYGADIIVRVTADCPCVDSAIFDRTVMTLKRDNADYVEVARIPKGIPVEAISVKALREAWQHASLPAEREHVTTYIISHPDKFRVIMAEPLAEEELPHWRLTLDTAQDYAFLSQLFDASHGKIERMGLTEIKELILNQPELLLQATGGG